MEWISLLMAFTLVKPGLNQSDGEAGMGIPVLLQIFESPVVLIFDRCKLGF